MEKERDRFHKDSVVPSDETDERDNSYLKSRVSLGFFPKARYPDFFVLDFPRFSHSFLPFPEGLDHERGSGDLRYWQVEVDERLPQVVRNKIIDCFCSIEKAMNQVNRYPEIDFILLEPPLLVDLDSPYTRINTRDFQHPKTPAILLKFFSSPSFEEEKKLCLNRYFIASIASFGILEDGMSAYLQTTAISEKGVFFLIGDSDLYLSVFSQRYTDEFLTIL